MPRPQHNDKRRTETDERHFQLKELRPPHLEILRLKLLGMKNSQIADMLHITPVTVSNCLASPKARAQLALLEGARDKHTLDLAQTIAEYAPRCFEVIQGFIEDENTPVHIRAREAREMLGIAGFVKPNKVQVSGNVSHYTAPELEEIRAIARERAAKAGLLVEPSIDVDFKECSQPSSNSDESDPEQSNQLAEG